MVLRHNNYIKILIKNTFVFEAIFVHILGFQNSMSICAMKDPISTKYTT